MVSAQILFYIYAFCAIAGLLFVSAYFSFGPSAPARRKLETVQGAASTEDAETLREAA